MKEYDNIIIGFGKAGKTIAVKLRKKEQSVALIEKDPNMYGGTCINVACIPSKALEVDARESKAIRGGDFGEKALRYKNAIERKRNLTAALRQKNYEKVASSGAEVINGEASFVDKNTVSVNLSDGTTQTMKAKRIFINTGAVSFIPNIEGLNKSKHVYTSKTLMELDALPKKLTIIGGGYIGLEFASYYNNFGSKVTIIQDSDKFIPREDEDISKAVLESFEKRRIEVLFSAKITNISDNEKGSTVNFVMNGEQKQLACDAILVATGRRPNVQSLCLEKAGIKTDERGNILFDEHLKTSVDNIYVMGDAKGGLQFTYISLDDSRIVFDSLFGGVRTTKNTGVVPYSVFVDPPLSRVGLSEKEAKDKGYNVEVALMPAAMIPKAKVMKQPEGLLKAIVDKDTNLILGAHLFMSESHEVINIIKLAMDNNLPYTSLMNAIFTHPTMSESLNDLFSGLK